MAPIQTKLIDAALLAPADRAWLNAYHAQARTSQGYRLVGGVPRCWSMLSRPHFFLRTNILTHPSHTTKHGVLCCQVRASLAPLLTDDPLATAYLMRETEAI